MDATSSRYSFSRYSFSHSSSIFFYNPKTPEDDKKLQKDYIEEEANQPALTKTIQFTRKQIMTFLVFIVIIITIALIAIIVAFTTKNSNTAAAAAAEKIIVIETISPAVIKIPSIKSDPTLPTITNQPSLPTAVATGTPRLLLPPVLSPQGPQPVVPQQPVSPVPMQGTVRLFDDFTHKGNSVDIPLELNRCNSNLLGFDNRALSATYDVNPPSGNPVYRICYFSEQGCAGRMSCFMVSLESEREPDTGPHNFGNDDVGASAISSVKLIQDP